MKIKIINKFKKIKIFTYIYIFLFCLSGYGSEINAEIESQMKNIFQKYKGEHLIYINKKNFMLYVYNRDLTVAVSYKIGYGLNPDKKAKLYAGDSRTPEGIYKITEILSLDADKKTTAYKKLRDMNSVYFKAKEGHYKFGHKEVDLGYNAYGPRFFRIDYPNSEDTKRYNDVLAKGMIPKYRGKLQSIGSGIAIHGNADELSIGQLASSGCIRMYNNDIPNLDKYIGLGTPVIISN
jgi:murein L,D-transpeptidase YafK